MRGGTNDPGDWIRPPAQAVREALARDDTTLRAALREPFDQILLETALDHTEGHRQLAVEKLGLGWNMVTRKLGVVRGRKPRQVRRISPRWKNRRS